MAGLVQKFRDMLGAPEDEYEDEEYVVDRADEIISGPENHADTIRERETARRGGGAGGSNKVVNIHATTQLQVVLFKPERFGEETRAVADELLKMHTVVLKLEYTNKDISRRIIDFLSGVAYANGGKIKRVAASTFIITPYNVELTGDDVLDELENNGVYF